MKTTNNSTFLRSMAIIMLTLFATIDSEKTLCKTLAGYEGRLIVFYSENRAAHSDAEIYVMKDDGSGQTRITNNPAMDITPSISHEGRTIVFISNRNGNKEVYKMNTDGSNVIRLTNNSVDDAYPFYSYDGSKIIYCSKTGGNWEVYLMNADGTNQQRVTNTQENEEWAHLSPDLQKIVCSKYISFPNFQVCKMNVNGSGAQILTNGAFPKWSSDGATIAYQVGNFQGDFSNWTADIYLMNNDGSNNRKITGTSQKCINEDAYWSPDGNAIVFQSNRDGNFQIYKMNSDGTNQIRLTNHAGHDYWPSWGRDNH